MKQISLSVPENILEASRECSELLGFRSIQEYILQLLRDNVGSKNIARWKAIHDQMKLGKAKKFSQNEAVAYLKSL